MRLCPLSLLGAALSLSGLIALADDGPQREVQFQRDVLPILSQKCFACHGFDEQAREADLRLDTYEGATSDESTGTPAIVAGNPDTSELIARVSSRDPDMLMPPPDAAEALSPSEIETLRSWIAQGAKYKKHWAFEPLQNVTLPEVATNKHPIDYFVHRRLTEAGLSASEREDHAALLRRLCLDLIGLPPTNEELDSFLEAAEVNFQSAYATQVERLLSSPHYGERWARWWLDQARYADSNGYSIDAPRQIWKYRDWVIQALNQDMPFDQFTIEQLAGDLLPDATLSSRVATGFHRNTQINQEGGIDKEQFRIDSVFDRVATTGTVWMGLTIGCAQCHDHKFDPVSQQEFYRLFAFFNNQDEPSIRVHEDPSALPQLQAEYEDSQQEVERYLQSKRKEIAAWLKPRQASENKSKLSKDARELAERDPAKWNAKELETLYSKYVGREDPQFKRLIDRRENRRRKTQGVSTMVLAEREQPRTTHILIKGDFTRPAEEVLPGTPSVLHNFAPTNEYPNRLDLAKWIVSPDNPLTSRVIANRVWQVYFGRGLVETENDFGMLGSLPTHPQLLDWLALDFQEKGWSLKQLHRTIVTSATYQQSSSHRPDLAEVDPNNYLLGRQSRLRLEAELVRDVCLSVSGLLAPTLGGPPVYPPIPDGVMNQGQVQRSWKASTGEDRYRRGIYTFIYRATPPPSLNVFDAPSGFSTCTRRVRSNTPLQALTLLNDQSFVEFASALENRIKEQGIESAFRACTARYPTENELKLLENLSTKSVARVLLNLDETVTRN